MAGKDTLLWLADIGSIGPDWFADAGAWLSESEQERLARFARQERRRQFVAGRVLLRRALGELLGAAPHTVLLRDRPGNAPVLVSPARPGLGLSISHSGPWVACAVSTRGPLGLDIERTDAARDPVALAEQAFGAQAAAQLMTLDTAARGDAFYRMWCRHEADIKLGHAGAHALFFNYPGLMLALSSMSACDVAPVLVDLVALFYQSTPKSK
ncbi:4'-phosphopantetheinyl transferase superfamily protein [uncultured Massilia sp.]|uniref:4'-phosphopantetheinyl transferase family protein n=1 Tax=uncultured Massilia sp. TaxID=169973 RepID=UPI00258FFB45|nr:4'-phosphopantetheinyl transferase superfamily protein [uncultured Massilia sp.]